jgi:hypothetical protein
LYPCAPRKAETAMQNEQSYLIGNRSLGARTAAKVVSSAAGETRGFRMAKLVASTAGENRDLAWRNLWLVRGRSCTRAKETMRRSEESPMSQTNLKVSADWPVNRPLVRRQSDFLCFDHVYNHLPNYCFRPVS